MAFNVNLLKTRAQCLAAKALLEAELDTYSVRNVNLDYQDRQAERAETVVATRLATAISQLAYATKELARPDLSDADHKRYRMQELTARQKKERLEIQAEEGVNAFVGEVDADQVDGQVEILTRAIAATQVRHDALPA